MANGFAGSGFAGQGFTVGGQGSPMMPNMDMFNLNPMAQQISGMMGANQQPPQPMMPLGGMNAQFAMPPQQMPLGGMNAQFSGAPQMGMQMPGASNTTFDAFQRFINGTFNDQPKEKPKKEKRETKKPTTKEINDKWRENYGKKDKSEPKKEAKKEDKKPQVKGNYQFASSGKSETIDDKTMEEVKRKAGLGIPLVKPTDGKMGAYNRYNNRMYELGVKK